MHRYRNISSRLLLISLGIALTASVLLGGAAFAQDAPAPAAPPVAPAPSTDQTPPAAAAAGSNASSTETNTPAPQPAPPSVHKTHHLRVGPQIGAYLPTDGKTRNRFGSDWISLGVGLGTVAVPRYRGEVDVDLSLLSQTGSDKHVYIAPLGLEYRQGLVSSGTTVPYVGASVDLVFADLRSPQDNVHSGLRTTGGGSLFIGTTLGGNSYIEARYLAISSLESFNLSGMDLTAGIRF